MKAMKRRIMLVDDEEAILQSLRRLFRRMPCAYGILRYELEIEMFSSPMAALSRAREAEFDGFLSDYRMPAMDGVEFLRKVTEIQPDAVQILFSGNADRDAVEQAFQEVHIFRFIAKPWDDSILVSAIAESLNYRDLMLEKRQHDQELK
jgi:two-component system, probable response regulator PhcQ